MRKMTWILGMFVGGLCLAELASGQQGGFGGFGGGGGGFGKADPVTLINNASVKKELDITDEQTAAVPTAVLKALGGVLNEKQFKRFKQIHVQQQGAQAFADKSVQGELKLTAAQKENVKTILDDNKKELAELGFGGKGGGKGGFGKGGGAENLEKLTNLNKETLDKLNGMLTADQKTTWKGLTGDKFTIELGGFGGGAGGFGKGKGKKKAE